MKTKNIVILSIIGLFVLIFAVNEFEIAGTKFWGVRRADAQRQVFEQTQSYVESKRQELVKLKFEYDLCKDSNDKQVYRRVILNSFANVNRENLLEEQRIFLNSLEK